MRHGAAGSGHVLWWHRRVRISDWFSGCGPLTPDNVVSKFSIQQTTADYKTSANAGRLRWFNAALTAEAYQRWPDGDVQRLYVK
jgi:hypothetical protein